MRKLLFLLCLLPLAACVDMDLTLKIDGDNATVSSTVTMGPEGYQMMASSGEDMCEDGVATTLDNGDYQCTTEMTGTIDEMIAELEAAEEGMDPDQTAKIEKLEDGNLRVSFDLAEMKASVAEGGMDPGMLMMMQQMLVGRNLTFTIEGQIVETNGTLSDGGDMATLIIPLDKFAMQDPSIPDSFVTIVAP